MPPTPQSFSSQHPIGVDAAEAYIPTVHSKPKPKIFEEFKLIDQVGIVTGGNRGLGLEICIALLEAGARAVYSLSQSSEPSPEFLKSQTYIADMDRGPSLGPGRLEHVSINVADQSAMLAAAQEIGDKEGRMDFCFANAGILSAEKASIDLPGSEFEKVLNINVSGALFTAQAAAQQMKRFKARGSIVLMSSMAGSIICRVSTLTDIRIPGFLVNCCQRRKRKRTRGFPTMQVKEPCCKWVAVWHANWPKII